jgi:DNA-binding IclR family transcriptional regulator
MLSKELIMPDPKQQVSEVILERTGNSNPTQNTIVQNVAYNTGYPASTVIQELNRLVNEGKVTRADNGRYTAS